MDRLQKISWGDLDVQKFLLPSILAASVVLTVLYKLNYQGKPNNLRSLPGPRPWPIIGNLAVVGPLFHQDFARLAKTYGPLYRLWLGSVECVVVSSPEMAKQVLTTHDHVFSSRPTLTQSTIMSYNQQDMATTPYGPYVRYVKKILAIELMSAKRLQGFQNLRKQEIMYMLHSILEDYKMGNAVNLAIVLGNFTKNIMTQMAFSKKYFGQSSAANDMKESTSFVDLLKEMLGLYHVVCVGDFIPLLKYVDVQGYKKQMRAVVRKNDLFFDKIIEEHRQMLRQKNCEQPSESDRMDLVDVLLTRPPEGNDGKPLTDTQIKAILVTTIAGGTDTSSAAVEWAMTQLLRHPAAMKRAQDELDAVVGRDRLVEETDTPNLHYMRAVVMETMRLHPSTFIPHLSTEPCEMGGYHIPANAFVFVNIWAMARDPAVWERPLEFEPERFLEVKKDYTGQPDYDFLPFGSGRRVCPGRALGVFMVEYALAALLQAFNWEFPPGVEPQDQDLLTEAVGTTNSKAFPLKALASPRLPLPVINKAPL